jgi:MmgE/PrpD C-terminal domain/MmgE/PrpD N-terminal domain
VQTAFGIAASRSAGVRANSGTMAKALQAGEASRSGVVAALLARDGFTANPDAIDGPNGWLAAYADGRLERTGAGGGAGGRALAIEAGIKAKLYPSCAATHGVLHALRGIVAERGRARVSRIRVEIPEETLRRSLREDWPENGLQAKFSLAFCVAVMVARGSVEAGDFNLERIAEVAPAAERVSVIAVAGDPAGAARVHVEFDDGTHVSRVCPAAVDIPVTSGQLRDKFIANLAAAGRSPARAGALLAALDDLPRAPDLAAVCDQLALRHVDGSGRIGRPVVGQPQDVRQRAVQVLGHELGRLIRVAFGQRPQNLAVLGQRLLGPRRQVTRPVARQMQLLVDADGHVVQVAVAHQPDEGPMEVKLIRIDRRPAVLDCGAGLVENLLQLGQLVDVSAFGEQPGRVHLKSDPNLVEISAVGRRVTRNERALVGHDGQQALAGEVPDRLAQRRPADAKRRRELHFVQPVAGTQLPAHDHGTQRACALRGQAHARRDRLDILHWLGAFLLSPVLSLLWRQRPRWGC